MHTGQANNDVTRADEDGDFGISLVERKQQPLAMAVSMIPIFGADGSTGPLTFVYKCKEA